jgi:N-acyl-D-amino-acid deacylase
VPKTKVLIRNATVVDGSGNPSYRASVLVKSGRVQLLRGREVPDADRTIDARGLVCAPGFIDIHSHTAIHMLADPLNEPKIRQGVTTDVVGADGMSLVPYRKRSDLERFIWLDSGINGSLSEPPDWSDAAGLMRKYDGAVATNVCHLIGNGALRLHAVGWGNVRATDRQTSRMRGLLRECLQEGAWGLSSGLDYPPGMYADTAELVKLCRVVAEYGGFYHTHVRRKMYAGTKNFLVPFVEAIDIGRQSGAPVHLTHFRHYSRGEGSRLEYLDLLEGARRDGLDVTFDCYPYPYTSASLVAELPGWSKEEGPEGVMKALRTSRDRRRLKASLAQRPDADTHWSHVWITNLSSAPNARFDGLSVSEIARLRGESPVETVLDLLLEEELRATYVGYGADEGTLPSFVSHPHGMIASDAIPLGDHPSPRTYGTFPLVLGEFVRAEKFLSLEEAVRKMTALPAHRLGLRDRGTLRDGAVADIVLFDPLRIGSNATFYRPQELPMGIEYVLVDGSVVLEHGRWTGALPGRSLRRGTD